jgi:hypothetical protein
MTVRSLFVALAVFVAAAPAALAQVGEDAAEALSCAADALGPAGETLATVRDVGTITYFGPSGDPVAVLDYASYVDFAGERLRLDLSVGDTLVAVQQVTPEGGFLYAPETGTVDLPESELARYREGFVTGATGLRLGADRERAAVVPDGELAGVSGTLIELVTNGVEHAVLLNEDCRFLGERTSDADLGEVVTTGAADAPFDGWWLPTRAELVVQGALFARLETTGGAVNEPIDDAVFARP